MASINDIPAPARIGIGIAVAIALYAGGYYFLLQDMKTQNTTAQAALDKIIRENNQLKQYEPKLSDLTRQIAGLQQQIAIQSKIVPPDKQVDGFINIIQDTATDAGVSLRFFKPMPLVEKDKYFGEMPFGLQVDGPFFAVVNFFDRVSKLERIVNIEDIKVASIAKGGGGGYTPSPSSTVVVTCVARTFYTRGGK